MATKHVVTEVEEVSLPVSGALVQNLGPGVLYIGSTAIGTPITEQGLRLGPGESMYWAGGSNIKALASVGDGDCDVRIQGGVTGHFIG